MPSKSQLPPKENALFKRVAKCYELKQYKNGLKFAKQILSNPKFALHGETLAMKGLILNSMGRKQEAYEFARKGLRNDLTSHVCWHAFGILQRSDKKYDESIKCYRNALKYEKDNTQILRDLSLVQIQTRDLEGYRETKYQLFKSKPGLRLSWIEFALACHLLQDYDFALKIIDEFIEKNHTSNTEESDYENSELLLYKTMIMKEAGQISEALEHLKKSEKKIFDKITLMETTAELLVLQGNFDEAKNVYIQLLNRNSENTIYFEKFLEANQLTEPELIVDCLEGLQIDFPKSVPLKLLILKYSTGEKFESVLSSYLKANLRKGVPPLFKQLKSLYQNKEKVQVIEQMLLGFSEALLKHRKFHEDDRESEEIEHATTLLWTYFYLAQHFDYLSNTERALYFVHLAIEHTPTLIELIMLEGRIYKHAGNIAQAVKCLDEAQSLDTADRYINSKCAKYMLKANNVQQAEDLCSKFTREGVTAMECLNEMQCMWFQIECALAFQRQKKYGDALKKCHEIDRHFSEIIEDQFDFHTYCMRKVTLRSYVNFLRLEDILRSHPFYFKAAKCAIEVYLTIYDHPETKNSTKTNQSTENLEPSELKKFLNKQRKAKKKAEQKNEEAAQALVKKEQYNRSKQQQDVENDAPQLDELLPEKLLQIDDPLEQAIKFLKPLQNLLPNMIETHLFAFEIYYRQKKIMLMLQAIKKAFEIEKTNGKLHSCIIRFYCFVRDNVESKTEILQKIIHEETDPIFQKLTAVEINKNYLLNFGFNFGNRIEAARMYYFLNPNHQTQALELLLTFKSNCTDFDLKDCELGYTYLRNGDFGKCDEETKKFMEICKEVYPYATVFWSNELQSGETNNLNDFHNSPNVKTETCDKD